MDPTQLTTSSQESSDIFSLSDQVLSDRLQFIKEIGFGNWGSVWLCSPKSGPSSTSPERAGRMSEQKIAVKLVHRSKTTTTAARVRSLWNEMKIVRSFKNDPHPSIIPFHSFIITPSYALITMAYLPTLVPVEVEESKSREWFRFLLSGVEFLHKRGVVHNDIKPANILLSHKNIPVLVDFGFAEKYDLNSATAFHSNLSYGTPEYLSPERARGLPHDTRKADVWSLGVTFFEILVGRTPFEHSEGEQFTTKDDLERYWSRTLRGKWVGTWKMSQDLERLLHRMTAPNADLRCTASQAIADTYWTPKKESLNTHRRSSSYTSSVVFEKDMARLLDIMSTPSSQSKENCASPPGLEHLKVMPGNSLAARPTLSKSKSQPKVASTKLQPRKRVPVPPIVDLSPIKASPSSSPLSSATAKENILTFNKLASSINAANKARKPLGALPTQENSTPVKSQVGEMDKAKRKGKPFGDLTARDRNNANTKGRPNHTKESSSVRNRVLEWEREKQRLREMEKLEDMQREEVGERVSKAPKSIKPREQGHQQDKENNAPKPTIVSFLPPTPTTPHVFNVIPDTPNRILKDSNRNIFTHSIKKSIDKTFQICKTSTLGQVAGRSTSSRRVSEDLKQELNTGKQSWADEVLYREVNSSLPVVHQVEQNERLAADSRLDRMTIWMRNVEKVVEDARQNFASASTQDIPLPPLPLAPLSRNVSNTRRSSRLPRKVLAASQIFTSENESNPSPTDPSMMSSTSSKYPNTSTDPNITTEDRVTDSAGQNSLIIPEVHTPSRKRRATVSTRSPEPAEQKSLTRDDNPGSPSQRKEKSRSHGNLFQLHIAPISLLEAELNKASKPEPSLRLSQVLDRSLFIAPPLTSREDLDEMQSIALAREPTLDDLTSSPCHVEPYPPRMATSLDIPVPDTPSQRRIESAYDRFLMATSGVKRLGKGYQSDNAGPVCNTVGIGFASHNSKRHSHRAFYTARRPMPPPVSSEDQRHAVSVDELGVVNHRASSEEPSLPNKDETKNTAAIVRKALKAIVPSSRRMSRVMV